MLGFFKNLINREKNKIKRAQYFQNMTGKTNVFIHFENTDVVLLQIHVYKANSLTKGKDWEKGDYVITLALYKRP